MTLGRAQCEVLSCVDLKKAFHSLPLTPEAKEFCGILCGMANKQDYITIMDDLLIHGFKGNHLDRLEALFKAMIKHGLKLSPKKC